MTPGRDQDTIHSLELPSESVVALDVAAKVVVMVEMVPGIVLATKSVLVPPVKVAVGDG